MVAPLQWAEEGEVPFRAREKLANSRMQENDTEWFVAEMFEVYEKRFLARHPFIYEHDLGLSLMFGDAEDEAQWNGWSSYITVEDVGLPGYSFSFGLYSNPFEVLSWECAREKHSG